MDRCPVCRARFKGQNPCRRCKSDLGPLIQLEEQAGTAMHQAVQALAAGDTAQAERLSRYAVKLHRSPFALALHDFVVKRCM